MSPPTLHSSTLPRLLDPSVSHLRDITLIPSRTPDRTLTAHRFVLAAVSPVLRASLSASPASPTLTLAHADYHALHLILHFIYAKPPPPSPPPPDTLWAALSLCISYAIHLPLHPLTTLLLQALTPHNVLSFWVHADNYNLHPVQLKCRFIIKHNFNLISRHPEFLHLCPHLLARLLRFHDLVVPREDDVFHALERWLAYDLAPRAQHALHLLRLVRLPTISDRALLRVCRSPYFGGHNEFYQLLLEALIRRTEVRIVHAPRLAALTHTLTAAATTDRLDALTHLPFKPMGVTDARLFHPRRAPDLNPSPTSPPAHPAAPPPHTVDYNRRQDRTVLFEGMFPLRWYKSVRFRPRSPFALLFTVVIPRWSTCRRRFISESRSFLNHKWSMWVDPFSADPTRPAARDHRSAAARDAAADGDGVHVGSTTDPQDGREPRPSVRPVHEDSDYISMYLCCESELGGSHKVDARVDFALFVVSATEEYGMERKVCVGRTFKSHGQAMGFRRHIRRTRLHSKEAALYSRDKDELVVGAHLFAPDVERSDLGAGSFSLSRTSVNADDFRSESPLSPASEALEGSRMTTMETEPSPVLTSASRITA